MNRARLAQVLLTTTTVFIACGGSESDGGPSLDDLPEAYSAEICGVVERCFGELTDVFVRVTDCTADTAATVRDGDFANIDAAVEEGRTEYNPGRVSACLAALQSLECQEFNDGTAPECQEVLVGQVADGEECDSDIECTFGSHCDTATTCPGECRPRASNGDPCTENDECVEGSVCSSQTNRCTEPLDAGETCGGGAAVDCDFGLFCTGNEGNSGECMAPDDVFTAALGATCAPGDGTLCAPNLYCALISVSLAGGFEWECQAAAPSGGDCAPAFPDMCPANEYCATTLLAPLEGTCTVLPDAGEQCITGDGVSKPCQLDLVCDAGTCIPKQHLGGPCETDVACYSERCEGGACVRPDACE